MVQPDIKKVVAFYAGSQLGDTFAAAGVSAGRRRGLLDLFTHAFFKGLLFLRRGSVIHVLGGEQDMRRMGPLGACDHLCDDVDEPPPQCLPFFSGYYSKDTILEAAWGSGSAVGRYAWVLGTLRR